jgi:hypothetical protein
MDDGGRDTALHQRPEDPFQVAPPVTRHVSSACPNPLTRPPSILHVRSHPTHSFYDRRLPSWRLIIPSSIRGYWTSGACFVLDVTEPMVAQNSSARISPVMDRVKKWSRREYYGLFVEVGQKYPKLQGNQSLERRYTTGRSSNNSATIVLSVQLPYLA